MDDPRAPFWSETRHSSIPGYRGRPGGDDDERYWDPEKPPCVPSDFRPPHLFGLRVTAEAVGAARHVEECMLPPDVDPIEDDYGYDEDSDELARLNYKIAMKRLLLTFPELDPCPMLAHASQYDTRPCPCGRGALARWPWVVQCEHLGFCDCWMGGWELTCWRSEWIRAGGLTHKY